MNRSSTYPTNTQAAGLLRNADMFPRFSKTSLEMSGKRPTSYNFTLINGESREAGR